jgi:hypothetical protein
LELEDGWKRGRERSILIGIEDLRDMNRFHKRLEEEVDKLLHLPLCSLTKWATLET